MMGTMKWGALAALMLLALVAGCDGDKAAGDGANKPAAGAGSAPAPAAEADAGTAAAPASQPGSAPSGAQQGAEGADGKAPRVFFVWPEDNSKIFEAVTLVFGVEGMTVTPAGEAMDDNTRGHHHIIIDGEPVAKGEPVPADDKHIHFGKGQTETELTLTPGKHTLMLQFADGAHRSYGPEMTSTINVEVVTPETTRRVFFEEPAEGAKVSGKFKVRFGLEGMTIKPAGESVTDKTTGHHHIIIDGEPVPAGQPVPADDKHIHFGKGQTETELELPAGKHTLTLQFADGGHRSYGATLSSTINIEVE